MRYIKLFEGFYQWRTGGEGLSKSEIKSSVDEISDILLSLKDDGFPIKVKSESEYGSSNIYVNILDYDFSKSRKNQVKWVEISDDVERVVNAVSDKYLPIEVYYKFVQPDGRIFNRNEREFCSWESFQTKVIPGEVIPGLVYRYLCFFSIIFSEKPSNRKLFTL